MHGFPKIHGYQHGYPWFLDVILQLSIQAWISILMSKHGYQCKDIPQWISVNNKYPWMDVHVLWISVFNYPCFYGYPFGYPWISMDIHASTCYWFSIQGCNMRNRYWADYLSMKNCESGASGEGGNLRIPCAPHKAYSKKKNSMCWMEGELRLSQSCFSK